MFERRIAPLVPLGLGSCAALVVGATTWPALAATEAIDARAQRLFDEGRALLVAGRYDEACPKFAESFNLDAGGGTLLNLAICHEKQGKTGSAWREFQSALERSERDGRVDRKRTASERLALLEPIVPRLVLEMAQGAESVEGLLIRVDGVEQAGNSFPLSLVVDPGTHEVLVTAPGRQSYRVDVSAAASQKTLVTIPSLARVIERASPPPVPPHSRSPKASAQLVGSGPPLRSISERPRSARTAGFVLGGVGVALVAVGGYFGVRALAEKQRADDLGCDERTCPTDDAKSHFDAARTNAHWSTAGIALGLAAVGVGAYFVLSEGGDHSKRAVVALTPDRSGGLLSLRASY